MAQRNRGDGDATPSPWGYLAERLEDRPDGRMVWRATPTKKRKKIIVPSVPVVGTVPPPSAPKTPQFMAGPVVVRRGEVVEETPAYTSARLARLLGERAPLPVEMRRLVLKRDGYRCRYCRKRKGPWHIDHVYPVVLGGTDEYDNLVTACQRCNLKKGMQLWTPIPLHKMRRR